MIDYRVVPEQKVVVICNWDITSIKQIIKLEKRLLGSSAYRDDYDCIVVNRFLEAYYTCGDIKWFATKRWPLKLTQKKIAVIATENLCFGISRMYQTMAEGKSACEISVFRDKEPALAWIGREDFDLSGIIDEIIGKRRTCELHKYRLGADIMTQYGVRRIPVNS